MNKKPIKEEIIAEPKQTSIRYVQFNKETIEIPQFSERVNTSGSNAYIKYGADNNYPYYLRSLSNKCSRHSAIIKIKSNMVGGGGFSKGNLSPNTINFLKNIKGDLNCDQILARNAYDFLEIGAFAIIVSWSKDRKTIARLNYVNVDKLRLLPAGCDKDYPHRVYWLYCEDWSNKINPEIIAYPQFDIDDREGADQILYVKQAQGSGDYYGIPSWISVASWCETDYYMSEWHRNNIKNGMTPNLIINFNSVPPEEEQNKVVRRLKNEYDGASNAGKTIFTFSDGSENAPIITPVNLNDSDQRFKDLNQAIETNVFIGHQVTNPALYGCFQPGKLDNTSNLVESLSIYQSMVIDHIQKVIALEFNKLANINGIAEEILINKYKLNIEVNLDVKDILLILQSTITDQQKQQVFVAKGYTMEQALLLCPPNAPIAPEPVKIPTTEIKP